MRNEMSLVGALLATALFISAPALAAIAPPASDCEGDPNGCGGPPPPPPPLPDLPAPLNTMGYYWVNLNGAQPDEGHINNGRTQVVYDAATRSYGNGVTGTTLTTTKSPFATAMADSHSQGLGEGVEGSIAFGYTVVIHAANLAAADALRVLIGANSSIASVRGNYTLAQSGEGLSVVHARTSGNVGQLTNVFDKGCDGAGLICGSGGFNLALGFQSATNFLGGDPLDFIGGILLESDAFAGRTRYTDRFGTAPGTAYAFIDPLITLNPALGPGYTLTIGGGQVGNGTPGAAAVPEPASWALMLVGFGVAGVTLRRRNRYSAVLC